jgi:hypothetical protein
VSIPKSNPQLDRQISQATDAESVRQIMMNHMEASGITAHERGDNANEFLVQRASAPAAAAPAALPNRESFSPTAQRVIYPHGNLRLVISGVDDAALDAIEERIKRSFESQ